MYHIKENYIATNTKILLRQKSLVRRLHQLMKIILPMYLDLAKFISFKEDVNLYRDNILKLIDTRGILFTVKYVKTSRNCVMRYLGGNPLTSVPGVALDSEG